MKRKLTHNLGLKILSLAIAILVWMLVLNIEDPVTSVVFSDIVVTEVNADQINEAGKSYTYVDGNKVSVRVKGKTSIINKLTQADLLAVADLANLSITGAVAVDVSCPKYPSLEITAIGSSTILQVEIEDMVEKSFNVKVITSGTAADGYFIGTGVATPNMVTISGPESDVGAIAEAVVYVTVNAAMSDITTNGTLELLDVNGNSLSLSTLTLSQADIAVSVPIYPTKTVALNFEVSGEVAEGCQLVSVVYEPKQVTIAGSRAKLAEIDAITLEDYDITGIDESMEVSIVIADNLAEALPDGIVLTDRDETVAIQIEIQSVLESQFELVLSRISLKGSAADYDYVKSNAEDEGSNSVMLTIEGIADEITALTSADVTAIVDVSGYTEGEYDLPVSISFDNHVVLIGDVYVHVSILATENEE